MAKKSGKKDELQPIIIKKIKRSAPGHHGGAWKVAYADFVTAMMAFFLLLWLLNVTTEDAQNVISSYFDPSHPKVSSSTSGAGGVMGGLSVSPVGAMVTNVQPITAPTPQTAREQNDNKTEEKEGAAPRSELEQLEEKLREQEDKRFEEAKQDLEEKLKEDAGLRELAKHLMVDVTDEGLRIQIVDQQGEPMFPSGSAEMYEKTKELMKLTAKTIIDMPNEISVRGHTDSYKYPEGATYTNWELSADRANASRRVLAGSGIDEKKLSNVMGKADTDHLNLENPLDAKNRRITIMLMRENLHQALDRGALPSNLSRETVQKIKQNYELKGYDPLPQGQRPDGDFKRTPGEVYFP